MSEPVVSAPSLPAVASLILAMGGGVGARKTTQGRNLGCMEAGIFRAQTMAQNLPLQQQPGADARFFGAASRNAMRSSRAGAASVAQKNVSSEASRGSRSGPAITTLTEDHSPYESS